MVGNTEKVREVKESRSKSVCAMPPTWGGRNELSLEMHKHKGCSGSPGGHAAGDTIRSWEHSGVSLVSFQADPLGTAAPTIPRSQATEVVQRIPGNGMEILSDVGEKSTAQTGGLLFVKPLGVLVVFQEEEGDVNSSSAICGDTVRGATTVAEDTTGSTLCWFLPCCPMKAGAASLAAGILGGTGAETPTEAGKEMLTFHHEGFFWRCWFFGKGHPETIWTFWYTSQAHPKFCMHGYLFPMPIAVGPFPHPSYDTTAGVKHGIVKKKISEVEESLSPSPFTDFAPVAVYRGFWTAFILLAVAAGLVGGFLLVCGVPFSSPHSYKAGGGFLLLSGGLFLLLVFLFVMWKEFAADFQKYILLERSERCLDDVPVHVYYGWSFMFAAAGVPLVLLSGLLFFLVGRDIMDSLQYQSMGEDRSTEVNLLEKH
ncbi:hypothetical protein IHE44_0003292, partial [Lamprotornis superbus]